MPTSSSSDLEAPADLPETPDTTGAYPRLTDEQIMLLSRYGDAEACREGHRAVLRGGPRLRLLRGAGRQGRRGPGGRAEGSRGCIAVHGPGRFLGDLSMLTGQAVYVTAVAQTDVEVLEVPVRPAQGGGRRRIRRSGDLILRAFILRRNIHADLGAGLRIIGSSY